MDKGSSKLWLLFTTLFALAVTTFTLSHIVTHPWHEIPELGADGGKNIFTYLYQVLYGKGIWFDGMNYPYGEHIVYTDAQPLLSVLLSYLPNRLSIGSALTIMWWTVALSYILAIVYCFKILRRFNVAPFMAMCFAGLIVVLSPQLFRISGHYALSYACVIPMIFYWTLQYHESKAWKYLAYIFVLALITTFLHPYYAAVSLVWAGCYGSGYVFLAKEKFILRIKHVALLLISVFAVFGVFGLVMRITDPAKDRPTTPFGILANCTTVKDVVTSSASPVWKAASGHIGSHQLTEGGEGRAYIGLVAMLVVGLSFAHVLWKRVKAPKGVADAKPVFQPVWLLMAFVALLFGMGAPFTWHMEWLLDYASLLKQFRTLGRFSWIFYYIISIYSVVMIHAWYTQLKSNGYKVAAPAIVLLAAAIWSFEASGYVARTHKKLDIGYGAYDTFVSTGTTNWEQFLRAHGYKKEDFQATLVLPFFEVGSEKLWVGNDENISAWAIAMSIQAGIELHLPMIDGMMSRTSWKVAFDQVKLVGGPYTEKPTLKNISVDKPFLLVVLNMAQPGPDEQYLLYASELIGDYQNCKVYACYPARIRDSDSKYRDWNTPGIANTDTCDKDAGPWYVDHFEKHADELHFAGNGGVNYVVHQQPVIANFNVSPFAEPILYEFSCWFLVSKSDYKTPVVKVDALDKAGTILATKYAITKESTDNHGLWLRNAVYIGLPAGTARVRCTMQDVTEHTYEAMDELMIRPADAVIISKFAAGVRMINNHLLPR